MTEDTPIPPTSAMSVEACDLPRPYINDLEYYLEFGGTSPFVCAPGQLVELLESESPLAVHVSEGPEYFVASCEYALYASDITRTFPLSSEWPSKEAANIYKLVERMQESCIKRLAPGVRYLDLHILAHQIAIDGLLALGVYSAKEGVYKAGTSRAFHESMSTLNQTTVIRGASLENTAHGPSKGLRTIWTHTEPLRDNLETRLLPLFRSRAEAWQVYGSVLGQKPELRLVPQEDGFESNIEPTRNEYEGGRKGKRKYELECVERKSTEYMLANRYHGPSVCKDLRMPPPVVEYCLNRPKETDWLLIRSETLRWNTSVILDEVSSSTPFPDNAKLLVHGMRELGQLLLSLRLSPFMIRILPFFFFAHTHAQPSTARSSSSIEPDWRQRALGALTDNLVMFAFLLFPLVVLTITGCAANRFRRNSQEGKAALSMLGMAVIFIAIPAIPEGHNASKNDRYMRVAIGLSYAFFMTVYCMLIALRHRWYKGRCAIAGGLAILMTIVSMGSTSVQSYWTDSTKTDPIFALSIAIPTSFTLCDLVAYLSDAFKSPGGPGLPAPVPGPQQGA